MPTPERKLSYVDAVRQSARLFSMAWDAQPTSSRADQMKHMATALKQCLTHADARSLVKAMDVRMAMDAAPKPSEKPHDLSDLAPGVDAALSDPSMGNKMRWLLKRLTPEEFCQWLDMELNDTTPAQDAEQRLTPPAKAMDARMAHDAAGARTSKPALSQRRAHSGEHPMSNLTDLILGMDAVPLEERIAAVAKALMEHFRPSELAMLHDAMEWPSGQEVQADVDAKRMRDFTTPSATSVPWIPSWASHGHRTSKHAFPVPPR